MHLNQRQQQRQCNSSGTGTGTGHRHQHRQQLNVAFPYALIALFALFALSLFSLRSPRPRLGQAIDALAVRNPFPLSSISHLAQPPLILSVILSPPSRSLLRSPLACCHFAI